MAYKPEPVEPSEEMVEMVDQMLQKNLKALEPEDIENSPKVMPGVMLEKVQIELLDREGQQYEDTVSEYNGMRGEYLAAMANHPTTRALALLAVGKDGVKSMELGKVPRRVLGSYKDKNGRTRQKAEYYNCHHIVQKSSIATDGKHEVNVPGNLVLLNTFASKGNKENAHHFFHGAILHGQTHGKPGDVVDHYAVRPAFPIYPPVQRSFESVAEVKKELKRLDPQAKLPDAWAKRLVAYSKARGHEEFQVPDRYINATNKFSGIYIGPSDEMPDRREEAVKESAKVATDFLPAGAWVDGEQLPADHKPKVALPIMDEKGKVHKPKVEREQGIEQSRSFSSPDRTSSKSSKAKATHER